MRVPLSWLADHADIGETPGRVVAAALIRAGLEVERVERVGSDIEGVVVARVLDFEPVEGTKKPIRYCHVDDGKTERGVICGATNFAAGDLVPLARPGARLPGGMEITARRTYGHVSDGMICSGRELGVSDDGSGILVLPAGAPLGVDVVEALGLADEVLDIAVTPDRGYCLSVRGIARETATALDLDFRDPAGSAVPHLASGGPPVVIEDFLGCDRFVARRVDGLASASPTPATLARRITLAGMRPISLAVDVTNYVLLELGQPLHAYDAAKLTAGIQVRRARAMEKLVTLDGAARQLDPEDLVIADGSGAIGLAGVMGGATTEIDAATSSLVLEAAHFEPATIARTARRHRLSTEASRRFERGVDDALPPVAAERAISLLAEHGGATPAGAVTDVDARPGRPVITIPVAMPGRIAGAAYPPATVRRRLEQVGATVAGDDLLSVTPPSWRPDLTAAIDLVEEVARLEGYDRLEMTLPRATAGRGLTATQRRRRTVGRALAAAGFVEVRNPPFVSGLVGDLMGLPAGDSRRPTVRVRNPLSETAAMLRASLLPGLFEAAVRNAGRGASELSLFEIARAFQGEIGTAPNPPTTHRPTPEELAALDAALPRQPWLLAVVAAGERDRSGWWGAGRLAGWADAVEAVRAAAEALAAPIEVGAASVPPWHPGRCAEIRVSGGVIGWAGELHPRVTEAFGLPARTVAAEIALDPLLAAAVDPVPAPAVSTFPLATLDVALVVDEAVPAEEVAAALREGAGPLLESLRLFDVYTGPQAGPGRKSLAYALRLRAPDRTLTAEEAIAARDAAVAAAAARFGAVLRGAVE